MVTTTNFQSAREKCSTEIHHRRKSSSGNSDLSVERDMFAKTMNYYKIRINIYIRDIHFRSCWVNSN